MIHSKDLRNLISTKKSVIIFEEENVCPICKSNISPIYIEATLNTESSATVYNHCLACHNSFLTNYSVNHSCKSTGTTEVFESQLISSEPCKFTKEIFDDAIISISPKFEKIYNQALSAEISGLDEIAGLGYRKALEFLIKDFAIHEHPDEEDTIKRQMLSPCIQKYIDDSRIKTLAERSVWIGNDEAHYIRKQEDRDIHDMKSFIRATVYFISMVLITEDAASIPPAK